MTPAVHSQSLSPIRSDRTEARCLVSVLKVQDRDAVIPKIDYNSPYINGGRIDGLIATQRRAPQQRRGKGHATQRAAEPTVGAEEQVYV